MSVFDILCSFLKGMDLKSERKTVGKRRADAEVYGFAAYLASFVLFGLYLAWAFIPDEVLRGFGLTYTPAKHWAISIPFFLTLSFAFLPLYYTSLNLISTDSLTSEKIFTHPEEKSKKQLEKHRRLLSKGGLPPIYDIPLTEVNQRMFFTKEI